MTRQNQTWSRVGGASQWWDRVLSLIERPGVGGAVRGTLLNTALGVQPLCFLLTLCDYDWISPVPPTG